MVIDFDLLKQVLLNLAVFFACLATLFGLKRLLWKHLHRLSQGTETKWDDILLSSIEKPVATLFTGMSLGVSFLFAPYEFRTHPMVEVGMRMVLIFLFAWLVDRIAITSLRRGRYVSTLSTANRSLLQVIFRTLFFSVVLLIMLDTAGISITPLLASLGVGSIAVALALQDTLGNCFSGLYLLIDKPLRVGDYIRIDAGVEGYVRKIGWRSTHIEQGGNNTIIIPNTKVASSTMVNYNLPSKELSLSILLVVAFESNLEKVEAVATEAAKWVQKEVPGAVASFEPNARFQAFLDNGIQVSVALRAKEFSDTGLLKHAFLKEVHRRFLEEEIFFPKSALSPKLPATSSAA